MRNFTTMRLISSLANRIRFELLQRCSWGTELTTMKDPTRIDNIVELFRKAWSICPDLSFEKFYIDKIRPYIEDRGRAFDVKFITILEKFIETKGTMHTEEDLERQRARDFREREVRRNWLNRRIQNLEPTVSGEPIPSTPPTVSTNYE